MRLKKGSLLVTTQISNGVYSYSIADNELKCLANVSYTFYSNKSPTFILVACVLVLRHYCCKTRKTRVTKILVKYFLMPKTISKNCVLAIISPITYPIQMNVEYKLNEHNGTWKISHNSPTKNCSSMLFTQKIISYM